jgi:hypothetical protein
MPSHQERVKRNYIWTCSQCFEQFNSKEQLEKHLKDNTYLLDNITYSHMHWSGNYDKK